MDCNQYRQLIGLAIDSQLDSGRRNQLDEHLSTCQQCREYMQAEKEFSARLASELTVKPPPELMSAVMVGVERYRFRLQVQRLLLGVIAVLLAGIVLGMSIIWLGRVIMAADSSWMQSSWLWSLVTTTSSLAASLVRAWILVLSAVPLGYWIGASLVVLVNQLALFKILKLPVVKVRNI